MRTADGGMPIPPWSVESHLAMMDKAGIATALLSVSSPGLHFLDDAKAIPLARAINEQCAGLIKDHPGRFGGFAILPLPDIAASLAELAYALDHLALDGVVLETNFRGMYLGDPHFAPLFDELERRHAVVFLHPTSPECLAQIGMGFPGPLIEFPFDTVRSVVSLIYAGVLRARPNIRTILAHGGGALPSLLGRIAMVANTPLATPRPTGGGAEVLEEVRKLYFDLALSATPATLRSLLEITDISHVLFGTDYPWAPPPAIAANTAGFDRMMAQLPAEQRKLVEYRNAASLFPRLKAYLETGA
jgi:predicted TIM-barrel fold metal-dependent hydrolase